MIRQEDILLFRGQDILKGEEALDRLSASGIAALHAVLSRDGEGVASSAQHMRRLRKLCASIGPEAISHLAELIEHAPWSMKGTASACFAAFPGDPTAGSKIYRLMCARDFDVQRHALDAVGHAKIENYFKFVADLTLHDLSPDDRGFSVDEDAPTSTYAFGKLSGYAIEAMLRVFAHSGVISNLLTAETIAKHRADNIAPGFETFCARAWDDLTPKAADGLIAHWLPHETPRYREAAVEALGILGLRRTVPRLALTLQNRQETDVVRVKAGIALSKTGIHGARFLADRMDDMERMAPGFRWAFSVLYGQPVPWPECSSLISSILDGDGDTRQAMQLSLAYRREIKYADQMEEGLTSADPFTRGASAIALARLLGPDAARLLEGLEDEATDTLETVLIFAGQLIAGQRDRLKMLDQALARLPWSPVLHPMWKREILSAMVQAEGPDHPRSLIWSEIMRERLPKAPPNTDPERAGHASGAQPSAATAQPPSPKRIFVSYSRVDASWRDYFQKMLAPVQNSGIVEVWSDVGIAVGEQWNDRISMEMRRADAALLLVSKAYLASAYVQEREIPVLLEAAANGRLMLFWVAVDHSLYEHHPLRAYNCANDPQTPLEELAPAERSRTVKDICRRLLKALDMGAPMGG